ncbi:MAG: hypothetical protein Q4C78_02625 [Synergistaceae bacterium]|nr:hypothetical protein [Synergistaceae bacterium]
MKKVVVIVMLASLVAFASPVTSASASKKKAEYQQGIITGGPTSALTDDLTGPKDRTWTCEICGETVPYGIAHSCSGNK